MSNIQLVECPRDAMQGIKEFIPTEKKIAYINQLLKVGFHTLDFGSFVSPKAIPQLADTAEVLAGLDLKNKTSELLAIVANERGAENGLVHKEIDVLGYPFSISDTFLQRNINSNIEKAYDRLKNIKSLTDAANKKLVVYISMAFGNPYQDDWSEKLLSDWVLKLHEHLGVEIIALSDTIGSSHPSLITSVFTQALSDVPSSVTIGAHLHSTPNTVREKVEAAYAAGCRRFDSALGGYGGCPMAADDLTGNMQTETVIDYLNSQNKLSTIKTEELKKAMELLSVTFPL